MKIWIKTMGGFIFVTPLFGSEISIGSATIVVLLLLLSIVMSVVLYISLRQEKQMMKMYRQMTERQLDMERKQNTILTNMSENVYQVAQKILEESQAMIYGCNTKSTQEKTILFNKVEKKLTGVTHDLINFLRIKSKKIELKKDDFNFNNVLNEVAGDIGNKFLGRDVDLVFDIDSAVPRYLNGDSLYLGQIISAVLENMLDDFSVKELTVTISTFTSYDDGTELMFTFKDNGNGLTKEEKETLFVPYYDEESSGYVGLGLFVAKELSDLMKGKIEIDSELGKGKTFSLVLPFNFVDIKNKRKYRLPDKLLTEKKIFIVDKNHTSALALKKMFSYFRHEVKTSTKDEIFKRLPDLSSFDILVIHESLLTPRITKYLMQIREGREVKIVAINSLFKVAQSTPIENIVDKYLFTPVNQETIFELIINLYNIEIPKVYIDSAQLKAKVYKNSIPDKAGVKRDDFINFKGKKLLIVEDSVINQKVLVNILANSEMEISLANNGQEAVEKIKTDREKFDIVLMDINMPVMDGYTATKMVRLDHNFDSLPIIAFTALAFEGEINKMFNSGINAFLAKPLNIGKLYNAFDLYISKNAQESIKNVGETDLQPNFEGLDTKEGIRLSNESEALYIELLKEFQLVYGSSDFIFEKLVKEHRYEQIKMLTLDLRGLTGTIGAKSFWRFLGDVYQTITTKDYNKLDSYIPYFKHHLQTLNGSINRYIALQEDLIA